MSLGPAFGYTKLPDASWSLGRSLRLFRSEVEDLRDDGSTTLSSAGGGSRTPTPEGTRS
jgi:sec-independent protein translocase protein TatA